MRCLSCGEEELVGMLIIVKLIPLAKSGGTLAMGGVKCSQKEMKDTWDKDHTGDEDRIIRGPIICLNCESHHYYVKGATPTLRLGSYEDACRRGVDALMTGDEQEEYEEEE